MMLYWKLVISKSWWDMRKSLKIESAESIFLLLAIQTATAFILWYMSGDAGILTRSAAFGAPFLLIIPVFCWKLLGTPAVLHREIMNSFEEEREGLNTNLKNLETQSKDIYGDGIKSLLEAVNILLDERKKINRDPEPNFSDYVQDLRMVSSKNIRDRVVRVAKSMRVMENSFVSARNNIVVSRREDSSEWGNQIIAQSQEHIRVWRAELMPEAVALWNEVRRRLYGAPPYPDDLKAKIAFEYGILAGVSPLHDAALALEQAAREMPG